MKQRALFCTCGSSKLFARGKCLRCYKSHWHDVKHFGGLRAQAIARDGRCTLCDQIERRRLLVHHRKPGRNALPAFATLCRGCHCQVHLRKRLAFALSAKFKAFWREQHREQAEQLELVFSQVQEVEQVGLFQAA